MAQSRLEKIGTIFTRVTGLLKSGAMKAEDKPLWYDVYAAFPPKLEPRYDRPAPNISLRKIFYEEDIIRAHFHKLKIQENIKLNDVKSSTQCQQYIETYNFLKTQGALDDEKIKEVALDMLKDKIQIPEIRKPTTDESFEDSNQKEIPNVNVKDIFKD